MEYIQILLLVTIIGLILRKSQMNPSASVSSKKQSVILDTSVIIDGRIVEVALAGFMPGKMLIPKFVIHELQLLADGRDAHKRERARFGLDTVALLQSELPSEVEIVKDDYADIRATDDKLVRLAKDKNGYLCTNDFNLNKVAVVDGVKVLNMNQLAQSVRPSALPGEKHSVKLVQKGSNRDQGVGYLDDGTMVVVAGAGNLIGKKVQVNVTRMLQTEAGKMMFATVNQSERRR